MVSRLAGRDDYRFSRVDPRAAGLVRRRNASGSHFVLDKVRERARLVSPGRMEGAGCCCEVLARCAARALKDSHFVFAQECRKSCSQSAKIRGVTMRHDTP